MFNVGSFLSPVDKLTKVTPGVTSTAANVNAKKLLTEGNKFSEDCKAIFDQEGDQAATRKAVVVPGPASVLGMDQLTQLELDKLNNQQVELTPNFSEAVVNRDDLAEKSMGIHLATFCLIDWLLICCCW